MSKGHSVESPAKYETLGKAGHDLAINYARPLLMALLAPGILVFAGIALSLGRVVLVPLTQDNIAAPG
jgi:hypothetical protein